MGCLIKAAIFILQMYGAATGCVNSTPTSNASTEDNDRSNDIDQCCEKCTLKCFMKSSYVSGELLFAVAGFMTASLIFSVGCIVSKCNNSSSTPAVENNAMDQQSGAIPVGYVANGGQNQKPEIYFNVVKRENNSIKCSTSPMQERTSYDIVEHNRVQSSASEVINDNPYDHVTSNLDLTQYDSASFVKPRPDVKDPTYSHLPDSITSKNGIENADAKIRSPKTPESENECTKIGTGSFKISVNVGSINQDECREENIKECHDVNHEVYCEKTGKSGDQESLKVSQTKRRKKSQRESRKDKKENKVAESVSEHIAETKIVEIFSEVQTKDLSESESITEKQNMNAAQLDEELYSYVERNVSSSNKKIDGYSVINKKRKKSDTDHTETSNAFIIGDDNVRTSVAITENESIRTSLGDVDLDDTSDTETQCLLESDESPPHTLDDDDETIYRNESLKQLAINCLYGEIQEI